MDGEPDVDEGTQMRGASWLRSAVTLLLLGALGTAYLFSGDFRGEVNRAVGVLASGDASALRDYILSYGVWAPVVSTALMVLQALAAFVPSFLLGIANGLAFGGSGVGCSASPARRSRRLSLLASPAPSAECRSRLLSESVASGPLTGGSPGMGRTRSWPPGSFPWSLSMRSPTPPDLRG